ncbi:MAG: hypothetical protein AMXMBFR80_19120 [Dehalococcoidia bacterium]
MPAHEWQAELAAFGGRWKPRPVRPLGALVGALRGEKRWVPPGRRGAARNLIVINRKQTGNMPDIPAKPVLPTVRGIQRVPLGPGGPDWSMAHWWCVSLRHGGSRE